MSRVRQDAADAYQFRPEERPAMPGSPYAPWLPWWRRLLYGLVALAMGVGCTFCNALISTNVATISGSLGIYIAQASWLPAVYVAMNASANLTLVKARIQFGLPRVTYTLLTCYALASLWQLAWPSFASAVSIRVLDGMTAAFLVSLTVYYLMQVFPGRLRPLALVGGLSLPQLGLPAARMIPVEFLAADHWRGLHLVELSVALSLLTLTLLVRLPPTDRAQAFHPLDLATIALVIPAMLLACGVMGVGRVAWWTDTPWLGWALAAAVPLFAGAILIESLRNRPLLHLGWLTSLDMLRFGAIALMVRLALAEQTYGSVGLLTAGGLTNDQLRWLFAAVALSMFAGMLTAMATLSEQRLRWQIMVAALLIAAGALVDTTATSLTRPPELYLSQCLIGFGTTLFIGPAMVFGFLRMFRRGPEFMISFVVLFSITQNVGSLAGSALLGSYQFVQARAHAQTLAEDMLGSNPAVVARIGAGAQAVSPVIADPASRAAEGAALLGRSMTEQANVLAFNDVFLVVAVLALMTVAWLALLIVRDALGRRPAQALQNAP
jgi:hypothetical protein